jgi:hypothetical protein
MKAPHRIRRQSSRIPCRALMVRTDQGAGMSRIPLGFRYQVKTTGRVPKLVRCEKCGYEYIYLLEVEAAGEGYYSFLDINNWEGEASAHAAAETLRDQKLRDDCAVVPCAECGHVQQHMLGKARWEYRRWMLRAGLYACPVGGILVLPAMFTRLLADGPRSPAWAETVSTILWVCAATLAIGGAILMYLWAFWQSRYDPNALPVDQRMKGGAEYSVSKDEYRKMVPPASG